MPTIYGKFMNVRQTIADHIADLRTRRPVSEILAALDAGSSKIVKVRAGYIFTERLVIETSDISKWQAFAQKGRVPPARS